MNLSLSYSPCPNDTFIFDALVNGKIDTGGLRFEVLLDDVQALNERAIKGIPDISKISYGVLPLVLDRYRVLHSGGALGKGVGPLLITNDPKAAALEPDALQEWVNASTVAIPGVNTTAHFLFRNAFPHATRKTFMRFDGIESFVAEGKGLGVIIHENRFTYLQKELHLLMDLGAHWEQQTGFPIPLGGIIIRKDLPLALQQQVDRLIQQSLAYAKQHYPQLSEHVTMHAQEMDESVMRQHIELYVNEWSMDIGEQGKAAVARMLEALDHDNINNVFI